MGALIQVHAPVLLQEVLEWLVVGESGIYLDGTLGAGGHAKAILEKAGEGSVLVGVDRDEGILRHAKENLKSFGERARLNEGSYEDFESWSKVAGDKKFRGALIDLGVSSLQLDDPERGFSFSKEAALDMRMSPDGDVTAADIVNEKSQEELEKIFGEFGEERYSGRIARVIVERRRQRRIETTTDLADIVQRIVPKTGFKGRKIHPATRVFQALRIVVNRELERLENFLKKVPNFLEPGGRVVVISYHSLEDRRAKHAFHDFEREDVMKRLTKKPLVPSETEVRQNPRSRSAKMRVAEKI